MPKYVFEVSLTLPAGHDLTASECVSITQTLETALYLSAERFGQAENAVSSEPPFEHVAGDFLPADDNGQIKMGPSRPIDL